MTHTNGRPDGEFGSLSLTTKSDSLSMGLVMGPAYSGQAPILLCPDVLLEILMHLQPGRRSPEEEVQTRRDRRECRKALLACALTCHTLSNVALDVLWRTLDDIRPLLQLLDTDKQLKPSIKMVSTVPRKGIETEYTFIRQVLKSQITPERWSTLQGYATRVREIGPPSHLIHRSVWAFLSIKCKGSPLLPHLYVLEAGEVSRDLSFLFLLLTPSLRSLSLQLKIDDPHVGLLAMQHITQIAPRIDSLNISGHLYLISEHTSTLRNLSKLAELCVLSCPPIPFGPPAPLRLSLANSHDALLLSARDADQTDLRSIGSDMPTAGPANIPYEHRMRIPLWHSRKTSGHPGSANATSSHYSHFRLWNAVTSPFTTPRHRCATRTSSSLESLGRSSRASRSGTSTRSTTTGCWDSGVLKVRQCLD